MRIQKTIPEYTEDHDINVISLYITQKRAEVQLQKGEKLEPIHVDLTPALDAMNATQLTTVRRFVRWILSQAYEVDESTIVEEDVFEPNA